MSVSKGSGQGYDARMTMSERNYQQVADSLSEDGDRETSMQNVVDVLWDAFKDRGYSWVGFYIDRLEMEDDERLILGPRRDKPACSPIGLHGACGQVLLKRETLIVHDVKKLGPNYIACDPRDQSEIVIPMIDGEGNCWGVLDIDSYDVGSFDERDELGLRVVLEKTGLLKT